MLGTINTEPIEASSVEGKSEKQPFASPLVIPYFLLLVVEIGPQHLTTVCLLVRA